jgi:hypothetical protein
MCVLASQFPHAYTTVLQLQIIVFCPSLISLAADEVTTLPAVLVRVKQRCILWSGGGWVHVAAVQFP